MIHDYIKNPKTNKIDWFENNFYRKNAISFFHVFGLNFEKRDYENDTKIINIGHDQVKDPDEEKLRRNTLVNSTKFFFEFIFEYRKYLIGLTEININYIYYCLLGSILTSLFSLFGIFMILLRIKSKMNKFTRFYFISMYLFF